MSAPVLARVRHSTARALEEAFSELWQARRLDDMVQEAQQAIEEYLDYPARAEAVYHAAYRAVIPFVQKNEPVNWAERGAPIREYMDSSLEVLLTLRKWVRTIENAGRQIPNAARCDQALSEMQRVRTRLEEHWPWPMSPEEWAEVEAEIERDGANWPTLEEAFADIAGMSKEAWLEKVEARRRELRGENKAAS